MTHWIAFWLMAAACFTLGWCMRVAVERMNADPYRDLPDTLTSHRSRQRDLGLRVFDEARAMRTLSRMN